MGDRKHSSSTPQTRPAIADTRAPIPRDSILRTIVAFGCPLLLLFLFMLLVRGV